MFFPWNNVAACTCFHHHQASRKPGNDDTFVWYKVIEEQICWFLYDCKQTNTNDGHLYLLPSLYSKAKCMPSKSVLFCKFWFCRTSKWPVAHRTPAKCPRFFNSLSWKSTGSGFLSRKNAIYSRLHVPWAKSWYNLKMMAHIVCSALRLHPLGFFRTLYVR